MDTGKGNFRIVSPEEVVREKYDENTRHFFKEGEIVELKGSIFRVKSIKPTELRLKLLKRMPL